MRFGLVSVFLFCALLLLAQIITPLPAPPRAAAPEHQLCSLAYDTSVCLPRSFAGAVFTDGGGAAVIKSLLANKSLKELRMWRCGLGDETLAAAREMLPANKTLETLTYVSAV